MPTEPKSRDQGLPRETNPIAKEAPIKDGLLYETPQPIGIPVELNTPKDLINPEGLPPLSRGFEIFGKDGFYVNHSICGIVPDSTNGGSVVNRYTAASADSYKIFFIARRPMEILWVGECHGGGTTGTVDLVKNGSLSVLSSQFDMSVSNDVVTQKYGTTLSSTKDNRTLRTGDTLMLLPTGSMTNMTYITVVIYCKYLGEGDYK